MRFGFITPRYGADIGSGAEHACRLLAEHVADRHDVEVLTTCASDAATWKNEQAEGIDRIRGVLVRRFPVSQPHDRPAFDQLTARLLDAPRSRADELEWVRRLGPWTPALIEHLKRQHRSYDALVFFSLWHPTTVHGLQIAPERSLLFPYLELQPQLRFALWADVLSAPRAIGLFSAAERRLLRGFVRVQQPDEIVGIGIDPPGAHAYPRHQQDPADALVPEDDSPAQGDADAEVDTQAAYLESPGIPFRRRHRLYGSFALYGGRVDADNGCEEMLEYFDRYASTNGDTRLVLMGVKMMKVPDAPYLRLAGVLPDRDRMIAYEAADVTIAPESTDLLALPVLESFAVGTPALVSARNEAAVDHCRRANGGLYYADGEEFAEALRVLMSNVRLRQALGHGGREYVRQNFRWDAVLGRFDRLVSRVKAR
ncbi:MAG TPA: glycosyltransferase [Vicinamibacterales bacterium]|nr:glycosyltransferase [Vicinamibacterales bacterium]